MEEKDNAHQDLDLNSNPDGPREFGFESQFEFAFEFFLSPESHGHVARDRGELNL